MADMVLRFPKVRERVGGLSKSWIYQEIKEGRFPSQIKLGSGDRSRSVGWLESEINSWVLSRIAQSRPEGKASKATADGNGRHTGCNPEAALPVKRCAARSAVTELLR
jgi:prophage regulatory protein